ncbi:MAG: hypothetical protein EXR76_01250 [Myxococcales bacterium]|nr:hypothetical protein [Myxococcales bacterium]
MGSAAACPGSFPPHTAGDWLDALVKSLQVQRIDAFSTLATPPQRGHWRSAGGAEIDLLLERDGVFHLIEVKLTSRPTRRDASGRRAFAESYPGLRIGHRLVIHGGPDLERLDEQTLAVPVDRV